MVYRRYVCMIWVILCVGFEREPLHIRILAFDLRQPMVASFLRSFSFSTTPTLTTTTATKYYLFDIYSDGDGAGYQDGV